MKPARRRPGQRAIASKAQSYEGYDLHTDKKARARAKFEGLSLGQASYRYIEKPYQDVAKCESYWVKDEITLIDNPNLSQREQELTSHIDDYDGIANLAFRESYPVLYEKIKSYVTSDMISELAKARRARHVGNLVLLAEKLSGLSRYLVLPLDHAMESSLPY